jgi:TRAP-type transport system periplasmic protein
MHKLLVFGVVVLILISVIFCGCSGSTSPAPANSAAPTTSAPKTTAPATSAAPAISAAPATSAAPAGTSAAGKSVTLKAVSFLPRTMFSVKSMFVMADGFPKATNGTVNIQYLGGPEVVPAIGQAEAVRQNVVQMSIVSIALYDGLVPLANMTGLSLLEPEQEHANGYYDYVNSLHEKVGLHFLERGTDLHTPVNHCLITNKVTPNLASLKGQKIGCSSDLIQSFLLSVGGTPVQVANTDAYTALERGVVDGMVDPIQNHNTFQLFNVTKYIVEPSFFRSGVAIIINLGVWNSLSKDQQDAMAKVALDALKKYEDDAVVEIQKAKQNCLDKGMKLSTFSQADSDAFLKALYDTSWADGAKRYPDVAAKLKSLSGPATTPAAK